MIIRELQQKVAIVSRHESTIMFLLKHYPEAKVFRKSVTIGDLSDFEIVIGNLPMSIASKLANSQKFFAVEFETFPPRGKELTETELIEHGFKLSRYLILNKNSIEFFAEKTSKINDASFKIFH